MCTEYKQRMVVPVSTLADNGRSRGVVGRRSDDVKSIDISQAAAVSVAVSLAACRPSLLRC